VRRYNFKGYALFLNVDAPDPGSYTRLTDQVEPQATAKWY